MKKYFYLFTFVFLLSANAFSQVTVSGAVSGNGSYSTLNAAFTAITGASQTNANIIVAISGNTTETAAVGLTYKSWTTLKIYPTADNLTISGTISAGPIISLLGAQNVTIDGRVNATGSTKSLTITNTSTASSTHTSTIRIGVDAKNNTIQYCNIKGSTLTTTGGVIYFSAPSSSTNSGNSINNNNITSDPSGRPLYTVFSTGTTGKLNTTATTISYNNFYDFLSTSSASTGIYIKDYADNITIQGNNFYETTNFTPTGNLSYIVINTGTTVNSCSIKDNYIGGNAAGSGTWTKLANASTGNNFTAILAANPTGTPTYTIQNNTIKGFDFTNNSGTATVYTWTGISLNGVGDVLCQGNTISSVVTKETAGTAVYTITGITKTSTAGTATIKNNTIGSLSNSKDINASAVTSTSCNVVGIYYNSTVTSGSSLIEGNTVANVNNAATNTSGSGTLGIYINSSSAHTIDINRNFIYGLTESGNAKLYGMRVGPVPSTACTVSNNIISLSPADNSLIQGGIYQTATVANYYHNTVYIGGSGNGESVALYNNVASGSTFKNNIFVNTRTNNDATNHLTYRSTVTTTNTIDNNDFYVDGSNGAMLATIGNTLPYTVKAIGGFADTHSQNADPAFLNSGGSDPTYYKSGITLAGVTGTSVAVDYSNTNRTSNAYQMGAWDVKPSPTITISVGTYTYNGSSQGPNSLTTPSNPQASSITYLYSGIGYGPTSTRPKNAGSYQVTATINSDLNYNSASSSAVAFTISPKTLSIDAASIASKVYDGSATSGTVTASSLSGFVIGETVTVSSAIGTYPDANVGTVKSATIVYTLANGTGGGLATNYNLANGSATGEISAKALSIGAASIAPKMYDGNTTSGTVTPGTLSGFIGSETVTVSTAVGTYSDATVENSKTATIVYTLANGTNGGLGINYSLANGSATGDITTAETPIIGATKTEADIPGTTADVTVSGATTVLSITDTKTVNSVTVEPGAKLNFSAAKTLNVTSDLVLKATDTETFSANLGSGGINVTGNVIYQRTMDDKKWYFLSFPCNIAVNDIIIDGGRTLGSSWFIKEYDGLTRAKKGTGSNWLSVTSGSTLTAYKGYIFGIATGTATLSFPLTKAIVLSEPAKTIDVTNYTGVAASTNHGWNLVGQPYVSKYNANNGSNMTNMWKFNGLTYNDYYNDSYVQNLPVVDPFAAYFTKVTADGSLSFDLASRQSVRSTVSANTADVVFLDCTTATGTDRTNIILDDTQSASYQNGVDYEKMITTETIIPQVYTVLDGLNYSYNVLPTSSVTQLPLAIYTKTAGSTTISVDGTKVKSLSKLLLTDNATSPATVTDLLTSNYTFNASAGTDNTRFAISAQRIPTASVIQTDMDAFQLSIVDCQLSIKNLSPNSSVRVFDAIGRMVANKNVSNNTLKINLSATGMYTVQIEAGGKFWTRKIVNQ
jgi:hypothetical protein